MRAVHGLLKFRIGCIQYFRSRMSSLNYFADVTPGGVFRMDDRSMFLADMRKLQSHRLVMTVRILDKSFSSAQMRFYRGVIVPRVREGLIGLGHEHWECTAANIHELLWGKFGYPEYENIDELSSSLFRRYIESIQRFCAIFMGIELPDPTTNK